MPPDVLLCQGTARALPLKDASCHVCVTSPPYYGLRDYGIQGQLGLEASPEAYIAAMVQVFREVWRVLRPDGTLWLNLGDSYAGSWGNYGGKNRGHGTQRERPKGSQVRNPAYDGLEQWRPPTSYPLPGLPAKNLLGMPWRLAFALQQDGWVLRSDIIWDKPSCMPESVQDRPTRSHEYIFLFSKQAHYHYDATAVRETGGSGWHGSSFASGYDVATKPGLGQQPRVEQSGRNARTVWRITSEPTPFAHFATMPQALVRRCLLAGAPSQVCAACGAPWVREVEGGRYTPPVVSVGVRNVDLSRGDKTRKLDGKSAAWREAISSRHTTDFTPTCACAASVQPATVLDPFCGSGTTLLVARELGHHAIGVDLSWTYLSNIARERLGLAALHAWTHGQPAQAVRYDDLPLFGG